MTIPFVIDNQQHRMASRPGRCGTASGKGHRHGDRKDRAWACFRCRLPRSANAASIAVRTSPRHIVGLQPRAAEFLGDGSLQLLLTPADAGVLRTGVVVRTAVMAEEPGVGWRARIVHLFWRSCVVGTTIRGSRSRSVELTTKHKILAIGEVLWDLLPSGRQLGVPPQLRLPRTLSRRRLPGW